MAPKRRKTTGRKTTGRKTTSKATARYVVNATFKMRSAPTTKTEATKLLATIKRKGGTGTMKKV